LVVIYRKFLSQKINANRKQFFFATMTILTGFDSFDNTFVNQSVKNYKHIGCPVCNNHDSRCKPSHGDSIMCWNTTAYELDQDTWHLVSNIDGSSGMRGVMVAPRRGSDYTPGDPEILELKRQQARQQRSLALALLPSVESRDKGYREILSCLSLSSKHSFELKQKRGLSADQVKLTERLMWFKTWQKDIECSENIAGVDPATGSTRWLGGMFISAIDKHGNILGGQIAADNIEVVGKYFWASSLKVGGYGCNLPHTNDMPLFVRKHPDSTKTSQIWLCEGGLKSAICALKAWETDRDIVVVGTAMSARFSDHQLIEILAELAPSEGVRILPDAGTVENLSILSGVLQTADKIKRNNYVPKIGWWDQWEKGESSQDIDDYLVANNGDYSQISWLTVTQFVSIVPPERLSEVVKKNESRPLPFEPQPASRKKANLPDFVNNLAYKGYEKYSKLDAPDTTKFGNIITSQPKLATDYEALESDGKVVYQAGWEYYPPRPGEIVWLVAGTGEGKSHLLAYWMNEYFKDYGCIFLGYRNGLLHQQCEKVEGLEHLRGADSDGFLRLLDPNYRVAFCDASLHNMKPSYAAGKILVIDEVMSVIESLLLGSTCSRQRRSRLTTFVGMVRGAEMVICLDAYLANWCVDLLNILSKKTPRKMQNVWKGEPRRVKMLLGTETNPNDKTAIRSEIIEEATEGKEIAVFSDSQHELESLHELMIKEGVAPESIARVDSKTSGEDWCILLLKNIDKYLETHPEIKILLVSPSGDSGLDISRIYFQKVFLILCGTLTINSALQMYGRVRDRLVPRTIFCAKDAQFRIDGGFTQAEIQSEMSLSIEHQLRLVTDGVDNSDNLKELVYQTVQRWQERERSDKFSEAVGILLAKANFERFYYRELFIDRLEKMGDLIEFVKEDGDAETKKEFQEISLGVKYAMAAKLVSADDINEIEAESLRRKELTHEQLMQIKKFDFQHRMPGIALDEQLAKTLLYDRSFLTGLEQRYYLLHPEVSKRMAEIKWGNSLAKREYFTSDLRSRLALRTDCLIKLGLLEFLDDREWLENGSEVKTLRQRWGDSLKKTYGAGLPQIMGFDWDKKKPIGTVHKLLDMVGCDLRIIRTKSGQTKKEQKIVKRRITFGSLNDPIRLAILESFDKRFEGLKSVDWQEVKTVCENELETEPELVTA
jgi:hypothetical protein